MQYQNKNSPIKPPPLTRSKAPLNLQRNVNLIKSIQYRFPSSTRKSGPFFADIQAYIQKRRPESQPRNKSESNHLSKCTTSEKSNSKIPRFKEDKSKPILSAQKDSGAKITRASSTRSSRKLLRNDRVVLTPSTRSKADSKNTSAQANSRKCRSVHPRHKSDITPDHLVHTTKRTVTRSKSHSKFLIDNVLKKVEQTLKVKLIPNIDKDMDNSVILNQKLSSAGKKAQSKSKDRKFKSDYLNSLTSKVQKKVDPNPKHTNSSHKVAPPMSECFGALLNCSSKKAIGKFSFPESRRRLKN
jgi:hypothetical protein